MRSRVVLCWGKRRLDSSLPKSDSLSYPCPVCLCECLRISVHAGGYKLFEVSRVASEDVHMCVLVPQ